MNNVIIPGMKSKIVMFRVNARLYEALNQQAKLQGSNISGLIRGMLCNWLGVHEMDLKVGRPKRKRREHTKGAAEGKRKRPLSS